jgi:hypothetical protein
MPITNEYRGEFIVTRMTGLVALPELLAHAEEIAGIESSLPVTPYRIAHLASDLVGELSFVELHAFAAKRGQARLKNPVKSAVVAEGAAQYGFARMFQTLNNNPDIRVEIFQAEAPALAWLRE